MAKYLILLTMLAGCGDLAHLDARGAASLCAVSHPEMQPAVDWAVSYWNEAGLTSLHACAPGSLDIAIDPTLPSQNMYGITRFYDYQIHVAVAPVMEDWIAAGDVEVTQRMAAATLAHELGHALGLQHVPQVESVMYHTILEIPWQPVPEDVAAAQKLLD